jgi:hypothetical protein
MMLHINGKFTMGKLKIRYSRACGFYQDFLDRGLLLSRKLLNRGFILVKMISSFET